MINPCTDPNSGMRLSFAGCEVEAVCPSCGHAVIAHRLDADHRGECSACEAVTAMTATLDDIVARLEALERTEDARYDYERRQREQA